MCCWEFHHEFIISGLLRRFSVVYVPSFAEISVIHMSSLAHHFRIIPFFMFRHFRKFPSFIFHHSFIISGSFPQFSIFYVPSFPEISVIYISSLVHHFRIIPWSLHFFMFRHSREISVIHISSLVHHFRIIPSFLSLLCSAMSGNFRHSYSIISGLFRRRPFLAVRGEFDPNLFSLETETQQYVLLGIR